MNVLLADTAAVSSAISFGLASVVEQKAIMATGSHGQLNVRNYWNLGRNIWFLAGLALDGLGYVAYVVALRSLPLFFVQAVDTASILVTAVAAKFWLGGTLKRKDLGWIALILAGLFLLASLTGSESAAHLSASETRIILGCTAFTGILALAAARFVQGRGVIISALSGLCFSAVAVLSRILVIPSTFWHVIGSPTAWLLALNGIVGITLFTAALGRSPVTIVYSITFVTETIIPTLIGLTLLGDTVAHHAWGLVVVGLAITIGGASGLTTGKEYLHHE